MKLIMSRATAIEVRFWSTLIISCMVVLSVLIAFVVGWFVGNRQIYNYSASQQQMRIEAFLREDR